jgi:hypothetical protein
MIALFLLGKHMLMKSTRKSFLSIWSIFAALILLGVVLVFAKNKYTELAAEKPSLLSQGGELWAIRPHFENVGIKEENEQRELATEPVDSYPAPSANQPSTVYKCKTKAGKTIIQTQPCEGDASTIDVRQAAITTPEQEQEAERRLEMFREMNRKRDEEAIRLLLAREAARQEQLELQRQRWSRMEMPRPNFQSPAPRRYANDDFKPLTPSCVPTIILPGNVDNCGNFYQGGCNNVGGGQFNCYDPIAPTPAD